MQSSPCHASDSPAVGVAEDARDLILRILTLKRVAGWCGVSESAVSQWLRRGTVDAPVPARVVPVIAKGAAAVSIEFDLGLLWPAMAGTPASRFGQSQ
jgi:hypothetical protein